MHALLGEHPQICIADPKELHLFDQVDVPEDARLLAILTHAFRARTAQTRVMGEATPAYCFFPHAIERLRSHNPAARIVMLLRHPAYRAFSHWRMERARGAEHLSFVDAISPVGRARTRTSLSALRTYSYIERGYFAPQVERLLECFGPERCHFLRTDAFWNDPQHEFDRLCEFLQVSQMTIGTNARMLRPVQVDSSLVLDAGLRDALIELYRSDIRRIEVLTDLRLDDWLAEDYIEPMQD